MDYGEIEESANHGMAYAVQWYDPNHESGCPLRAWLYRYAVQEAARDLGRKVKAAQLVYALVADVPASTPHHFDELVEPCSESDRHLLERRYVANMLLREIAEEEGVSGERVRQKLAAATERLARAMGVQE